MMCNILILFLKYNIYNIYMEEKIKKLEAEVEHLKKILVDLSNYVYNNSIYWHATTRHINDQQSAELQKKVQQIVEEVKNKSK